MSEAPGSDLIDQYAPWDGRRVPVTLLGGYLGAGKTTAINELLARTDRPIAVLVNDVGAVNIDASLIARRHGDTIELTDGCVCCSLSQGLAEAFNGLRKRATPPEHVVLELSGIAEPARVVPWADSLGFRLDGVIVLIDSDQFLDQVADEYIGTMVRTQLAAADLFLLTKTDLVTGEQLDTVISTLQALGPETPTLRSDSPMAAAAFLNVGTRQIDGFAATPAPTLFDVHATSVIEIPNPTTIADVESILDGFGSDVMRAKAIVRDETGTNHLIQVVGRRRSITELPYAESQPTTDLVVIRAKR